MQNRSGENGRSEHSYVSGIVHRPFCCTMWLDLQTERGLHCGSRPFFAKENMNIDDSMEKLTQRLTSEIIEACLDRDVSEMIGRSDEEILEGDAWREISLFTDKVMASERLRCELLAVVATLFGPEEARSDDSYSVVMERLQALLKSGVVTDKKIEIVTQVCRQFFFVGWHSRGAIEDAEKMKGFQ